MTGPECCTLTIHLGDSPLPLSLVSCHSEESSVGHHSAGRMKAGDMLFHNTGHIHRAPPRAADDATVRRTIFFMWGDASDVCDVSSSLTLCDISSLTVAVQALTIKKFNWVEEWTKYFEQRAVATPMASREVDARLRAESFRAGPDFM